MIPSDPTARERIEALRSKPAYFDQKPFLTDEQKVWNAAIDKVLSVLPPEADVAALRATLEARATAAERYRLAREAEIDTLREAVGAALAWYGLDGDGISEPTLSQLRAALASPAPDGEKKS